MLPFGIYAGGALRTTALDLSILREMGYRNTMIGPGRKSILWSQYYRDQSKYSPKRCRAKGKR